MNLLNYKIIPLILALASSMVNAALSDRNQPIYIDSDSQHLDLKTNTVIFTGDVFLRQGRIKIYADKIIVNRQNKKANSEVIQAYGNPASFQQTMEDGKKINGQALEARYEVAKSQLTMNKEAVLIQENGNKIEGQKITYNIAKQLLAAESNAGKRVTTVLQPQSGK